MFRPNNRVEDDRFGRDTCLKILVQKFGGTSLQTPAARKCAVKHVLKALKSGYAPVVVVSAMGRAGDPYATDTMLNWIADHGGRMPSRELDLFISCGEVMSAAAMCGLLCEEGIKAIALTGAQAGIRTNSEYGNAQIVSIDPAPIRSRLLEGFVVVVAGFQGTDVNGNVTTLGRGGSDTTATALAAALQAERVDIFTDVDGVLTADPRIVDEAQRLDVISYAEICNMAHHGAKVIHPRAVEIAMQAGVPIRVRSTFSDGFGTLVTSPERIKQANSRIVDRHVTGITHVSQITQIQITAPPGRYDLHLEVFKTMAQHHISVDFINVSPSGVVYTVLEKDAEKASALLRQFGYEPTLTPHCAKVAVIGGGMNGVPGIMAKIVEALTEEDIRILQSADSNTTIWVLVKEEQAVNAVRALHRKFSLHFEHLFNPTGEPAFGNTQEGGA